MPSARSSASWDWRELAGLGEQLVSAGSLAAQQQHILDMASRLVEGRVDVWLNEALFRLPDWDEDRQFPAQPPLDGMRRALQRRRLYIRPRGKKLPSAEAYIAVPLVEH